MDARQKKLERKKKRRGKIRQEHLAGQRTTTLENNRRQRLNGQLLIRDKDSLPNRNDRDGWYRLNAIRDWKAICNTAEKLFPGDKALKQYLYSDIGLKERDKYHHLSQILTIAAQEHCAQPPYFIPFITITPTTENYHIQVDRSELTKKSSKCGDIWAVEKHKHVIIDGKEHEFFFSSHAIEQLFNRVKTGKGTANDKCIHNYLFVATIHGMIIENSTKEGMVALVNKNKKMTFLLGINKPFGYCPYIEENGVLIAKTFLLPAMHSTPEHDILGKRIEITDITTLHDLQKQYGDQLCDLNLFTKEATEAKELLGIK